MARFDWIKGRNGNWNDADNWVNGAVPGASDSVYVSSARENIGNTGPTVTTSISVASVDDAGNVSFQDAGTCTISGDIIDRRLITVQGTDLTIGGTLTITAGEKDYDQSFFQIYNFNSSNPDHVTVGAIDNHSVLQLSEGTLDVQGTASFGTEGHLSGVVSLYAQSHINFSGTGQLTTIDADASLYLRSRTAFIADTDIDASSNSALTGLRTIDGYLEMDGGAEIDAAGRLTVSSGGKVELNSGSALAVHGSLVNEGTIALGNDMVREPRGRLHVDGTIVNNGSMVFHSDDVDHGDAEEFSGKVTGQGSFSLGLGIALTFDDAVGRHERFFLSHSDVLHLADAADFHADVHKFGRGDAYLFDAFDANTTYDFVANAAGTGGVLNVSDGAIGSAHIHMKGAYDTGNFALTSDADGVRITYAK